MLAKGHESRNLAEYDGMLSVDERLVDEMIAAATTVLSALRAAGPAPGET